MDDTKKVRSGKLGAAVIPEGTSFAFAGVALMVNRIQDARQFLSSPEP